MVRIDNTMLHKEEGGSGNKIKYGPEPYILKRRKANKVYDEQGRRVGADGQPVKLGRPRKPEAETTRGRKRIAAAARKVLKATTMTTTKAKQKEPTEAQTRVPDDQPEP